MSTYNDFLDTKCLTAIYISNGLILKTEILKGLYDIGEISKEEYVKNLNDIDKKFDDFLIESIGE